MKPAAVRFYFDADILGLAKVACALRSDCTHPGDPGAEIHGRARPACEVVPAARDVDWIPVTARNDWLVITRDSRIQEHVAEIRSVLDHGARMVALTGDGPRTVWSQLQLVMTQWPTLERLSEAAGPFVYSLTRTSLRHVAGMTVSVVRGDVPGADPASTGQARSASPKIAGSAQLRMVVDEPEDARAGGDGA